MTGSALKAFYPEVEAGGFTRCDGTVEFYTRINALLRPDMVVCDLGAGRGARLLDSTRPYVRDLTILRGKVSEVIGVDIDKAVFENTSIDRAIIMPDVTKIPLPDASLDLIVSDFTFEHVEMPAPWAREVERVLRPGGWLCARTPNALHYFSLVSRLLSDRNKGRLLGTLQPDRDPVDVFPAHYRMNTLSTLRRIFRAERWADASYTYSPEPGYLPHNRWIWQIVLGLERLLPRAFGINLFVFKRKY